MSIYIHSELLFAWWLGHGAATRFWNLSSHQLRGYVGALERRWTIGSVIFNVNVTELHVLTRQSLCAQKLHRIFVPRRSSDLLEAYIHQLDR